MRDGGFKVTLLRPMEGGVRASVEEEMKQLSSLHSGDATSQVSSDSAVSTTFSVFLT